MLYRVFSTQLYECHSTDGHGSNFCREKTLQDSISSRIISLRVQGEKVKTGLNLTISESEDESENEAEGPE